MTDTGTRDDGGSTEPLEDILDDAIDAADGEKVSVGEILEAFGTQSLGPVVLLAGLITIIPPVGMVPGLPAVVGAVLLLFSVQYVFGNRRIWLPERLENMSFERKKLEKARERSGKWLRRLDHLFTERLTFLSGPTASRIAAIVITLLALSMIPLELIPGAVAVPGWALIFFGVGLMARDGLFMALAFLATFGAGYLLVTQFLL